MSVERSFFDTNILLYLHSADTVKADRAEALVRAGGVVGIQVLNEMTSVLRRKLGYSWTEVNHVLYLTERLLQVEHDVVQVKNPRTGHYVKIDRTDGDALTSNV